MIDRPLWDAVNSKQQSLDKLKIAKSVPRLCFLSGLTGEEMMMFIDAFEETDLEPVVFPAHVPNSSNKLLQEIIEEVMGDHEMVESKPDSLVLLNHTTLKQTHIRKTVNITLYYLPFPVFPMVMKIIRM
ncbi:hypothetical protein RND81_14G177000 [Saponaria officinalis]|uniref:Uncharacterized protein n=1 Tax=Saponaria officinalis TaxID=3572 RepID=A0AAW1GV27_SAPOF